VQNWSVTADIHGDGTASATTNFLPSSTRTDFLGGAVLFASPHVIPPALVGPSLGGAQARSPGGTALATPRRYSGLAVGVT